MRVQIAILALPFALLGAATTASAQSSDTPNVYTVTLDGGVSHSYQFPLSVDELTYGSLPAFNADFSSSQIIQLNFLAPEGTQYVYNPAGEANVNIYLNLGFGQTENGTVLSAGFLGDNGQGPTDFSESYAQSLPGGIGANFYAPVSSGFTFTGFTATIQMPSDDVDQLANLPMDAFGFEFRELAFGGDPGSAVTPEVTATPEPSTLALAALGGASLLLYRRRK